MSAQPDDQGVAVDLLVATFLAAWPREVGQWSDLTLALWHAEFDPVPADAIDRAVLAACRTLERPPSVKTFRELVRIELRQETPALPPAPSDPAERERCRQIIAGIHAGLGPPARSMR